MAEPSDSIAPEPTKLEAPKTAPVRRNRAQEIVKAKRDRDERERREREARDRDERVQYLTCPRIAGHMAAFLTESVPVGGMLTPENWESLVHVAGEPWLQTIIPCQECIAEGEERPWGARVRPVARRKEDGSFVFVIVDRKYALASVSKEALGLRRAQLEASAAPAKKGAR